MIDSFVFPAHERFLNRDADLSRLEQWWQGAEQNALVLYGRRRVGKSWLFRKFAHGKPAIVLVADRRAEAPQLERFAGRLASFLDVRPALRNLPELFHALYALAADQKTLVVIDEFPYLLPAREKERDEVLTALQGVMEERDASQLKLVLCGSYIAQMERLLRGPLRGRLTPLLVEPLSFSDAQPFVDSSASAVERVERYAVAGGMTLYLDELGRGGGLSDRVSSRVLDPRGPLFNDPREVLEEELRTPGVYYSVLEELATGKKSVGDLSSALARKSPDLQSYLENLREMRVVYRSTPVTARDDERNHRYGLADDYMRFWFRFVFPFQEDLKTGLLPTTLYETEIAPLLGEHVSPTFEALCREWVLHTGRATTVGPWWGNALNELRRAKKRETEEVDVVGVARKAVTVVGESKWSNKTLKLKVLEDLEEFKIPAMQQAGIKLGNELRIALFSKSGFAGDLREVAGSRSDVELVDVDRIVADLLS